MRYKIFARIVRAFLMLVILGISFTSIMNLGSYCFNTKRYVSLPGGGKLGDIGRSGVYLPLSMNVSIPDTSIWYKNGSLNVFNDFEQSSSSKFKRQHDDSTVIRKLVNKLIVHENKDVITISNDIMMNGNVMLKFQSKRAGDRAFWFFSSQFKMYMIIVMIICLIKLINIYLKGDFIRKRSFKLISVVGILLIAIELVELISSIINSYLIPSVNLVTQVLVGSDQAGGANISFNFGEGVQFSNIGLGMLIVILSKIIEDAVLIKQENDLTI